MVGNYLAGNFLLEHCATIGDFMTGYFLAENVLTRIQAAIYEHKVIY